MKIQEHMVYGLLALGDEVTSVLFTDDPYYQSVCKQSNPHFLCVTDFKTNKYHMPLIQSIFDKLEKIPYDCSFYGYVNGDVLISPSILSVLHSVQHSISIGTLKPHSMIVGRRTNYPWLNMTLSSSHYSQQLTSLCSTDSPYMNNAVVCLHSHGFHI